VRRASIAGSGVFRDAASDATLRQAFFDGAIRDFQMAIPDFGVIAGAFQIVSLEYRGDHAAEVTFEIALESAGALTFAPL
jgi:TP901-1 family phage major tail protein